MGLPLRGEREVGDVDDEGGVKLASAILLRRSPGAITRGFGLFCLQKLS